MSITVADLREILEDVDDAVAVRLAMQPHWALEYSVGEVVLLTADDRKEAAKNEHVHEYGEEPGAPKFEWEGDGKPDILYLSEGSQIGYLPGAASDVLQWSDR